MRPIVRLAESDYMLLVRTAAKLADAEVGREDPIDAELWLDFILLSVVLAKKKGLLAGPLDAVSFAEAMQQTRKDAIKFYATHKPEVRQNPDGSETLLLELVLRGKPLATTTAGGTFWTRFPWKVLDGNRRLDA